MSEVYKSCLARRHVHPKGNTIVCEAYNLPHIVKVTIRILPLGRYSHTASDLHLCKIFLRGNSCFRFKYEFLYAEKRVLDYEMRYNLIIYTLCHKL